MIHIRTVADALREHISDKMFIGKNPKECHVATLDFTAGYIKWTMAGDDSLVAMPREYAIRNSQEIPCFFPDFFSFVEFVHQVNSICKEYSIHLIASRKAHNFGVLINKCFDWYKFVTVSHLGENMNLGVGYRTYDWIKNQAKSHPLVKTSSFISYLRWILPGPTKKSIEEIQRIRAFLFNCCILKTEHEKEFLELDESELNLRLAQSSENYETEWVPILQNNYQRADLNAFEELAGGASQILAAIRFGERTKVPYAFAHKYLREKQLEKDPEYLAQKMTKARLNKFETIMVTK